MALREIGRTQKLTLLHIKSPILSNGDLSQPCISSYLEADQATSSVSALTETKQRNAFIFVGQNKK